jgi:hypothetical protein
MAELKTKKTKASVTQFLQGVKDETRRQDSLKVVQMMREATGQEPVMWGSSLVGFGSYCYKYAGGREGEWFLTGFSPRKQNLTLYIMPGFERYPELLSKLGKYTTGKSCLYIKKLDDVHLPTLKQLIKRSVKVMARSYSD